MQIVRKETVRDCGKYNLVRHTLRTSSGDVFQREFIEHPGAAVMLPLLNDGRVVMVRNYRHVTGPAGLRNCWTFFPRPGRLLSE
jgi:ADP-ribose pyrophosphatase